MLLELVGVTLQSESQSGHFSPTSRKRDPDSSLSSTTDQPWGLEQISPISEPRFSHNKVGLDESKATSVPSHLIPAHKS